MRASTKSWPRACTPISRSSWTACTTWARASAGTFWCPPESVGRHAAQSRPRAALFIGSLGGPNSGLRAAQVQHNALGAADGQHVAVVARAATVDHNCDVLQIGRAHV